MPTLIAPLPIACYDDAEHWEVDVVGSGGHVIETVCPRCGLLLTPDNPFWSGSTDHDTV